MFDLFLMIYIAYHILIISTEELQVTLLVEHLYQHRLQLLEHPQILIVPNEN